MPTEKEYMAKKQLLDTKQDKLTAGTNITISPSNVISATGGGSNVSVTQKTSQGENIADIRVDGITTRLYAPGGGLRHFTETENTLYGRSNTSLFRCGLSQYYFNTIVTQEYTNGDIFEKANNTPAICLCTNFIAIGNYTSGGTIIISPNPLGVSFNATLGGSEYNTTYADTPSGDLGGNVKYEKGTYTDSDDNTWYWASIGGGGWQLVSVDNTIPFLTLADTGTISHEMDEIFATIEPEIFFPHNGIARNNNLAFFAGASDPTGADAPIKIYADGTYEGIGGGSDVSITPTLSTGTKIADYEIDGVNGELYAPTSGGGTGNVDDVYVNGTSVLDSNHIAQVKSYKELTQAEYDALPSSKLTDDIMYCITDAGVTEGDTFAPIIYSLAEREIGTWTDGKPLYQKTINTGALVGGTNKEISISDLSIDKCIDIYGYGKDYTNGYIVHINDVVPNSPSGCIRTYINTISNKLYISPGVDAGSLYTESYITLQYTKTTDTPGSAQYTPLSVPAVHYDNTEKIIGTWFGETLYEKSYEIDSISSQDTIIDNITNLNNIILFSGTFQRDLGDGRTRWYQIDGRTESSNNNDYGFCWNYTTNDGFQISIFGYSVSEILKYRITVQYTKTTS